jgi:hypothetical protein
MIHLQQTSSWDGQKFTITPNAKYYIKHSKVGDLKTAFIICFAFFGYSYVLNKRLSPVQQQIMNYKEDIIYNYWLDSDPKVTPNHFICLTETPVIAITVKLDNSTIILPWLEGSNDLYKHLRDNYTDKGPIIFKGRYYHWPRSLEMNLDFYEET